jgi:Icc protein
MKGKQLYIKLLSVCMFLQLVIPYSALAEQKPKMGFAVLSDLHVEAWNTTSPRKLEAALKDLNEVVPNSAALILNGDLSDGQPDDYKLLTKLLKQLPHPEALYASIGNHEFFKAWKNKEGLWDVAGFPNGETEQASIGRFLAFTGESNVYYSKQVQGYHFLFLGSEQYRQSNPDNAEDAYLSKTQLNWLRQSLQNAQDETKQKPIFVFLHQPLPNTVSGTTICCVNNRAVIQHEELNRILADYPQVILFSGHTHRELKLPYTFMFKRFAMVNTSSLQAPITRDAQDVDKPLDHDASEGLYVEVYSDKVVIKGRDFINRQWIAEANFTVSNAVPPKTVSKPESLSIFDWSQLISFNPAYLEMTVSKSFRIGSINWAFPN